MKEDKILQRIAERYSGLYRLVSAEFTVPGGGVFFPFGEKPFGEVVNTELRVDEKQRALTGRFHAQLMNPGRNRFATQFPTPAEAVNAYATYVAYCGVFTIEEKDVRVENDSAGFPVRIEGLQVNRVKASLNPNWVGGEQFRLFEIEGERLTLRVPPLKSESGETSGVLVWKKA